MRSPRGLGRRGRLFRPVSFSASCGFHQTSGPAASRPYSHGLATILVQAWLPVQPDRAHELHATAGAQSVEKRLADDEREERGRARQVQLEEERLVEWRGYKLSSTTATSTTMREGRRTQTQLNKEPAATRTSKENFRKTSVKKPHGEHPTSQKMGARTQQRPTSIWFDVKAVKRILML